MTGRLAALCAGAFLALQAPAAAAPSEPQEVAFAVARPALVSVEVRWHGWVRDRRTGEVFGGTTGYDRTASCGGAVINPDGYVATASHCVHTGADGGGGVLFDAAIEELAKAGRVGDPVKAKQAFADHGVTEGATPDSLVDREIQVRLGDDLAPATVANLVTPAGGDVAVLKVPRDRLPAMAIRDDPAPVGTPVLALGYPGTAHDGR
ncbi:trypsin-like peptidase domain-containing protein, partial [Actinophytocola sp.]|uniref:trypsin-like peptidase domain-containing protein n=1 Tax=Actinophytocola sp. TaxID=1872138 RepID=UPI002D7E9983